MARFFSALVLAALSLGAVACAGPASFPPTTVKNPLLGQPLPGLKTRSTLDGAPLDPAEFAGKPVVVKFFADYCVPCKETLPVAERAHQAAGDVIFIGVSEDEDRATAEKVVKQYGLTFRVIFDESKRFSGVFRANEMPRTFVADRAGIVRWIGGPGQTEAELKQAVEAARTR